MASKNSLITVTGDICIDWLQFPIKAKNNGLNYALYPGNSMIAKSGGALALAEFLRRSTNAVILSPELENLENISPKEIIHSNVDLDFFPFSSNPKDKSRVVYRVKKFKGFTGPNNSKVGLVPIKNDNSTSGIVVLDDAGNGFRDNSEYWPKAIIEKGKNPLIVYKMSCPIAEGKLWEHVFKNHADNLIVILNADDLRSNGINISRCLSWEKTALDFVWQIASNPKLLPLANCSNLVVRFGLDGAIHYTRKNNKIESRLFFDPLTIEDGFKAKYFGEMQWLTSAFVTEIVDSIANSGEDNDVINLVRKGVRKGLLSARRLFQQGFGSNMNQPDFPSSEFFKQEKEANNIADIIIPSPTVPEPADPNFWCILKEINGTQLEDMAYDVVIRGEKVALGWVPVGEFRGLRTVDRTEIESFRSIKNLMIEYVNSKKTSRPLSIAVFGSPGSGKSFGVTEVAGSVSPDLIVKVEFNISQFKSPTDLISAFHRIRDIALIGKIPLVFFDEFDSDFGGKFGWLKYFLAPMQDGKFREGETMHPIGKAIFVFAGGICSSFEEFSCASHKDQNQAFETFKNAKGPDFVSRLRGYVNILGPNCTDGNETLFVIRRAMILRSFLERKAKQLFDNNKSVRIDQGVLRAMIKVPNYKHGVRSMEAIIEMSMLNEHTCWEQAFLPPKEQLRLHVDEEMFSRLVVRDVLLGSAREVLGKAIHERYLEDQKENKPASDLAMQSWDLLSENLKESNRRQADHIPLKLRLVNCGFTPVVGRPIKLFEFTKQDIEIMAEEEHRRWNSDRRLNGWVIGEERDIENKISPHLVPWSSLPDKVKEYDRQAISAMPEFLAKVGFEIYKLR